MNYLKLNEKRYDLVNDGMICDGTRLRFFISAENTSISEIRKDFSNNDEFLVYDCFRAIDEETGNYYETDEFVATRFEGYTRIVSIDYNIELNTFCIMLVSPIDIDTRMADMESAMNFLLMG